MSGSARIDINIVNMPFTCQCGVSHDSPTIFYSVVLKIKDEMRRNCCSACIAEVLPYVEKGLLKSYEVSHENNL